MPSRCCIPLCKGNYNTGPKVSVYSFPKEEGLKKLWLSAIQRKDFNPTTSSRVCELHFATTDFTRESSAFDSKTGKQYSVPLEIKRLKRDAVPTIFPGYPISLKKASDGNRRDYPDERKDLIENTQLSRAIALSITEATEYAKSRSIQTVSDILKLLKCSDMGNFWQLYHNEEKSELCIYNMTTHPCPTITSSLLINSDLSLSVFLQSQQLSKLSKFQFPYTLCNINELTDVMDSLKNLPKTENKSNCLDLILHLLSKLKCEENENIILFIEEQLKLLLQPKNNIKYSNDFLIFSILLNTISPHCYKFVRSTCKLILPHPSTLRKLCQGLSVSPENEWKNENFLLYAKMQYKFIQPFERIVILLVDEIHVKPYFDYKGGTVLGAAFNTDDAAKSVFVFMITSVLSSLKEVIHVMPVKTITNDMLFKIILKIITGLENIGFKVICVVTDNNSINGTAMSLFASPPQMSYCYPHPLDNTRPLFYLIDSVHVFKCIRNNWLNQKNEETSFVYPDFEGKDVLHNACFKSLKKLHDIDSNSFVKFAHGLTLKSLSPSNLERQNVQLVIKVFNRFIIEALKSLGPANNLSHYEETANFISIILKWWEIMNVKSPNKGTNKLNQYMTPLTTQIDETKNLFLEKFLKWLDVWRDKNLKSGTLTNQTHKALVQTTFGMMQIAKYCKEDLKMSYILPGKFQTDCLESRFGKYRQLAGAQYNISVRQLVECEKKLRLQSLVKFDIPILSPKFVFDPADDLAEISNVSPVEDSAKDFILDYDIASVGVTDIDIQNAQKYIVVLTYLAGYCCHSILKKNNCSECKELLVANHEICVEEDSYVLIKNLNRGGLLWPKEIVVNCVIYNFIVITKLMNETGTLQLMNHRKKMVDATMSNLDLHEMLLSEEICTAGHNGNNLLNQIVWVSTNIFLKNFCASKNDDLSNKIKTSKSEKMDLSKKRKLSTLKNCESVNEFCVSKNDDLSKEKKKMLTNKSGKKKLLTNKSEKKKLLTDKSGKKKLSKSIKK